ncbi:MAG TPA: caspase family protein, partial [Isosphaeraceae bacterium]|nr:caspase family protein [Isosphaeraceae bacterium]
ALFSFRLGNEFRFGLKPNPEGPRELLSPPPAIAIDPPSLVDGQAEITLTLGHAAPESIRLYHNGIPVRSGLEDFEVMSQDPTRVHTRVQLIQGANRFYAMASSPGDASSVDGRSRDIALAYTESRPSRLHVVALGVGEYNRQKLQYAVADARSLSEYLRDHGLSEAAAQVAPNVVDRQSYIKVLSDTDVNIGNLDQTFRELKQTTSGHPEDTVVVFLAGHTDVYKNHFCLLRSTFPFDESAPIQVAQRGEAIWPVDPRKRAEAEKHLMPYSSIAGRLATIDPLQRLVIVDACQAEAIFNDVSVRRLEEHFTRDSQQAKTSYILASRSGEPAGESSVLKHGLLTYTLLRGMRDMDLPQPESVRPIYQEFPSADEDGDQTITATELRQYARETLPPLALLLTNSGASRGQRGAPAARLKSDTMRTRYSDASFPVLRIPGP